MKINYKYLFAFVLFMIAEIIIALFIHDNFIRPYFGDILVVILLYCFLKIFITRQIFLLPLYIFVFATVVEISQYFHLVEMLHLENNAFIRILLGQVFDFRDIVCYFIGCLILFAWELWQKNRVTL